MSGSIVKRREVLEFSCILLLLRRARAAPRGSDARGPRAPGAAATTPPRRGDGAGRGAGRGPTSVPLAGRLPLSLFVEKSVLAAPRQRARLVATPGIITGICDLS